jgi:hypothetical protein
MDKSVFDTETFTDGLVAATRRGRVVSTPRRLNMIHPEPRPSQGQVFIKFKNPKYERGFMVSDEEARKLGQSLAVDPQPNYVAFETAFGGLEFVRLSRFNSIEFINGVESHG